MKLISGSFNISPGWKILLEQEGLSYEELTDADTNRLDEYPLIIAVQNLNSDLVKELRSAVWKGNRLLVDPAAFERFSGKKLRKIRTGTLFPDDEYASDGIEYLEINDHHYLPRKNRTGKNKGTVLLKFPFGQGFIYLIPFDMNKLILDRKFKRKRFYVPSREQPSEIVADKNKGLLRNLFRNSIRIIFDDLDLPLVQKWYYPDTHDSVFIFRLDTDFCSLEHARSIYALCRKNDIRATWFVDTASEHTLANGYGKFQHQEIGFHCDRHRVFDSDARNRENVGAGLSKLAAHDIVPEGFSAPYGTWNMSLAAVLAEHQFAYSSEFTLDYDDLPFFPYLDGSFSPVLQIPVHPISPGRLRRSHFSDQAMKEYYFALIERNITRKEPIIIYHHPHHQMLDLLQAVFDRISDRHIPNLTMLEFNAWWKKRAQTKLIIDYDAEKNTLRIDQGAQNIPVIVTKNGKYLLSTAEKLDLNQQQWNHHAVPNKRHGIKRLFHKGWREYLYDFESRRGLRKQ